jgi:hypothetical protein
MKQILLSTMRPIEDPMAVVGQVVKYTGDMANHQGVGAVVAIRNGEWGKSYDVALTDGRSFNATHLDGSRWVVSASVLNAEQVAVLRAGVTAKEATDKANKSAAEQRLAEAIAKVRADNPWAVQNNVAKNIKTELSRAFPSVKFSVRTSRGAGCSSINVGWTDGPTVDQVKPITGKYELGSFDGMTDSYDYERSAWTEAFGGVRYVFENREVSDALVAGCIRRTVAKLGGLDTVPSVEDYRMGRLHSLMTSGGCDFSRELNAAISRHTCTL